MKTREAVKLFSVVQVAQILGVSTSYVYAQLASGELSRVVELGTSRQKSRVRADDLRSYVARYYSVKEAAEILGVGDQYIYDRIAAGEIQNVVQLGTSKGKQRISSDDLQAFIEARSYG
jgi:excisionase family DNA binding protein